MGKKRLVFLTIGGVMAALGVLLLGVYGTEFLQDKDWKSGKVLIGEHILTLPCSLGDFERNLNPEIIFNRELVDTRTVKVNSLSFMIHVSKDVIRGITVLVDEEDENSRELLDDIIFPSNVTVSSDFDDIDKRYGSVPLNVFKKGCFVNLPGGKKHECVKYANHKWEIEVYSIDKKISSIRYFYVG